MIWNAPGSSFVHSNRTEGTTGQLGAGRRSLTLPSNCHLGLVCGCFRLTSGFDKSGAKQSPVYQVEIWVQAIASGSQHVVQCLLWLHFVLFCRTLFWPFSSSSSIFVLFLVFYVCQLVLLLLSLFTRVPLSTALSLSLGLLLQLIIYCIACAKNGRVPENFSSHGQQLNSPVDISVYIGIYMRARQHLRIASVWPTTRTIPATTTTTTAAADAALVAVTIAQ